MKERSHEHRPRRQLPRRRHRRRRGGPAGRGSHHGAPRPAPTGAHHRNPWSSTVPRPAPTCATTATSSPCRSSPTGPGSTAPFPARDTGFYPPSPSAPTSYAPRLPMPTAATAAPSPRAARCTSMSGPPKGPPAVHPQIRLRPHRCTARLIRISEYLPGLAVPHPRCVTCPTRRLGAACRRPTPAASGRPQRFAGAGQPAPRAPLPVAGGRGGLGARASCRDERIAP